jgi:hypothetical protein
MPFFLFAKGWVPLFKMQLGYKRSNKCNDEFDKVFINEFSGSVFLQI